MSEPINELVKKYSGPQGYLMFLNINYKINFDRKKKIKTIYIASIISLFLTIFLFKNNGKYAMILFAVFFIAYSIINYFFNQYFAIGNIKFYEDFLELNSPEERATIIKYEDINHIRSTERDIVLLNGKKPLPIKSLFITIQNFNGTEKSFECRLDPSYEIFNEKAFRYRYWLETVLKSIDNTYDIKDIARKKEYY